MVYRDFKVCDITTDKCDLANKDGELDRMCLFEVELAGCPGDLADNIGARSDLVTQGILARVLSVF